MDAELQARIDKAIDRGCVWLKAQQTADGWWKPQGGVDDPKDLGIWGDRNCRLGATALCLYALRVAGVPPDDDSIQRGFAWARKEYDSMRDPRKMSQGLRNYPVSLLVLALEAHEGLPHTEGTDAGRYGRTARPEAGPPIPDLSWMKDLTEWLVRAQAGSGGFGYTSPFMLTQEDDHSNTQYSLLALGAARRCGIKIPTTTWLRALKHHLLCQEREGPEVVRWSGDESAPGDGYGAGVRRLTVKDHARGWGYHDTEPATGSMTAGGVSSVVLCRDALLEDGGMEASLADRAERSIRDGLAWLGLYFGVKEGPGHPFAQGAGWEAFKAGGGRESFHFYYLFGLERAGDLAAVRFMAEHDWYVEGAKHLLDIQIKNGSWLQMPPGLPPDRYVDAKSLGGTVDTSFALLFLKRAMLRTRGTATEEGLPDLSGASKLDDAAFKDLFDAVLRRFASASASGHAEMAADFVRLGTRSVPLLVLRLEDGSEQTRMAAIDGLRQTTGLTQGFDPKAPEEARASAVRAWEEWWIAHKDRLVADVSAGRFLEK